MGKVRTLRGSKENYDNLDEKDEDTLYVVSENGDFDPTSLTADTDGELYLGETKIGCTITFRQW